MENLSLIKKDGYTVVVANKDFPINTPLHHICCKEVPIPTKHTITLDLGYHILDSVASEINHSFVPNTHILGDVLISSVDIKAGDEIKRNYYETEEIILNPFVDRETGEEVNTLNLYRYRHSEDNDDEMLDPHSEFFEIEIDLY